jgi:transcriptional regulator with XRE-family HTH domain
MASSSPQTTTFGSWLDHAVRTRRDSDGAWLSQRKLAAAVGVQAPAINKIIAGRTRPSAELVIRIANYLSEDAAALLELAGFEAPQSELTVPAPDTPAKAEMVELVKQLLEDDHVTDKTVEGINALMRTMLSHSDFSGGGSTTSPQSQGKSRGKQ